MKTKFIIIGLTLAFAVSSMAAAVEEYMPMHPGAVSETAGVRAAPLRRLSSAESQATHRMQRAPLHRNMVTLQLPSLGTTEARPRMVDAHKSGIDGSLDFSPARPASPAAVDDGPDIPGLIVPEILAMDQYAFTAPEAKRAGQSSYPTPAPAGIAVPPSFGDDTNDLVVSPPASFENRPSPMPEPEAHLRRRDSLDRKGRSDVAFSRIEIPAPAPLPPASSPATYAALPPPPPAEAQVPMAASSLRPPPQPVQSLRPPPAAVHEPEAIAWSQNRAGANAVALDPAPEQRTRRASPRARAKGEMTPVKELKNVLEPIYRH